MYYHNSDGSIDNSVQILNTVTQQPQIYSPSETHTSTQAPTQTPIPQNTPGTVEHYRKCKRQRKKKRNMMMNIIMYVGIALIIYFLIKYFNPKFFSSSSNEIISKNEMPSIISKGTNLIEPPKISELKE